MQMDTIRVVNLRPASTGAPPGGRSGRRQREFAEMWGHAGRVLDGCYCYNRRGATAPCRRSRVAGERAGAYR